MRYYLVLMFIFFNTQAQMILISQKNINYKEVINKNNLGYIKLDKKINCTIFDIKLLQKDKYQAKHFIFKGKEICVKDLKKVQENSIQYDFGNMIIQRSGKVMSENDSYVKIKNTDGSIEKIYKNGQK